MNRKSPDNGDACDWSVTLLALPEAAAIAGRSVSWIRARRYWLGAGGAFLADGQQAIPRDLLDSIVAKDREDAATCTVHPAKRHRLKCAKQGRRHLHLAWSNPNLT